MNSDHSSNAAIIHQVDQYVIGNYRRSPVAITRGEGSRVWDADGRQYIDFFPGGGCNLLGHCPPEIVNAVREQAANLIQVSNHWYNDLQGAWAHELSDTTNFGAKVFFCNSGTEANEAAIKLARLHTSGDRYKVITFHGGSHGRTLGSLTATAQTKYQAGMGPLAAGFTYCPWGDLAAVESLIDASTAAILVEPVQCETGVRMPPKGFLTGLRELADRHELVLIFDEVHTGCGRTGEFYAHQLYEVSPDIITLSNGLCGGIVGAAMLVRSELADSFAEGIHGSTAGGNPIAAAAGIAVLRTIQDGDLLQRSRKVGEEFLIRLNSLASELELIREVRGLGMMIGIELDIDAEPIVADCLAGGLLINCVQNTTLRILPAINIDEDSLQQGFEILRRAIESAQRSPVEI